MREIFNPAFEADVSSPWRPIALFDAQGACVASVETCVMRLMLDGAPTDACAIRLVAVAPDWRGLGLFRDLMTRAITWCEESAPGLILLYAETEALYTRFGFTPVMQHSFVGAAPSRRKAKPARPLDPSVPGDRALIDRLLSVRAPVSDRCAILGPSAIFFASLHAGHDFMLAYAEAADAVIVYEEDDDAVVIVDVVAVKMPSIHDLLAALPIRPNVATLFAPDRLGWRGDPRREDAGLMIRGALPPAMREPFMLPPTAEF